SMAAAPSSRTGRSWWRYTRSVTAVPLWPRSRAICSSVADQVIPQGCDHVIPQVWPVGVMLSGARGPLVRDAPGSGAGSVAGSGHEELVAVVDQSVEQGLGHDG